MRLMSGGSRDSAIRSMPTPSSSERYLQGIIPASGGPSRTRGEPPPRGAPPADTLIPPTRRFSCSSWAPADDLPAIPTIMPYRC
ncbi:hypothetical protein PRIPAC_93632 [Pristionchus pacificus]|uniref:Uncharacterized protein n=1 Tax=Pristionchus pacificus TaxID=54126 RepID=A0A2A6C9I0_PRIPA|nr:hypothetical protein PRIPAC_93632 [Pristionchus pacificus]|eukprot:PDM74756.1 hypothetical protein PRIPAC_43707 [Pristionchus pacificus]